MIKYRNNILLGPPGSGKGTLAQKLSDLGFVHISTGNLFREKLQEENDESRQIQMLLNRGELIPDEITNKLAKDKIINVINANHPFLLDGYPRTIGQAEYLQTICGIDKVIYLDIPVEVLFKRITGRLTCRKCNRVYNAFFSPPKVKDLCDVCKIPLIKRRDDNETSFEYRMNEYNAKTKPLINYYENLGKLVKINVDCKIEQLVPKVLTIFND